MKKTDAAGLSTSRRRRDEARRIIGILLAGGLSRRYGSPKAFARLSNGSGRDDRMFYERSLEALRGVCDSVLIVANRELQARFPSELDVCTDLPQFEGQGPLAGICTAMRTYPDSRYVVMACDMPLIGPDEVRKLYRSAAVASQADVIAVRTEETAIPLFSVWQHDLSDRLETAISAGKLGVMTMLAGLDTYWIDAATLNPNANVFRNHNTPEDSDLPLN